LDHYEKAWKKAVQLFGDNQVSSFIIAGLGEHWRSILWGCELLADIGVYPYVVPLRPIPGSPMEHCLPPRADTMHRIYTAAAAILSRKGLSAGRSKAGCVRCGACSALPWYEEKDADIVCHRARSEQERQEAFAIRKAVFVVEQGLFEKTDIDENDARSIHLVAKRAGKIVGTVRVFPLDGKGDWVGGRLAVSPGHRVGRVGATLVREAMKRVTKRGCRRFTAHIQQANVNFFKKLGWSPEGEPETYMGSPHQLMVADLDLVEED